MPWSWEVFRSVPSQGETQRFRCSLEDNEEEFFEGIWLRGVIAKGDFSAE